MDRGHPQWPDLSFFLGLPEKSPELVVDDGVFSLKMGGGWRVWAVWWLID
jgi:hypothetical protein